MLIGLKEILSEGKKRGIAIGAFNATTSESTIAMLEAAEELGVPVIMMHAQCHEPVAPLDRIGPMMLAMAKASDAKVCVHLDHGEDYDYCKRAIDMGFNSVMIDYSTATYEENIAGVKRVVEYAHSNGADVEAELGALPQREGCEGGTAVKASDLYTKSELVSDFVSRTGCDALAIAFGTAHGLYKTKPTLNTDIITAVGKVTSVPLVMHGGSGISDEQYREVIAKGVVKINYYTYMSYAGYAEAKRTVEEKSEDFFHTLAWNVKNAMKVNIIKTLKVFSGL